MRYSEGAKVLVNLMERNCIFQLLAGLNVKFDPLHVHILGKDQLPPLNEVFFIIRAEESR